MSLCTNCCLALRQAIRQKFNPKRSLSTKPTPQDILSKPTWSVKSLLSTDNKSLETISPIKLHHLLRLSALPLPKSPSEEATMIQTLQTQLQFVRAVQSVDTIGVNPLCAIRDETNQGILESTVTLETLKAVLDKEEVVGHYKRPRRTSNPNPNPGPETEGWDVLGTASRRAGKFFVVQSKKMDETSG